MCAQSDPAGADAEAEDGKQACVWTEIQTAAASEPRQGSTPASEQRDLTGTVDPFISSTFQDMEEERNHLINHSFPELTTRCRQMGGDFKEIDLRWGFAASVSALCRCSFSLAALCVSLLSLCRCSLSLLFLSALLSLHPLSTLSQ